MVTVLAPAGVTAAAVLALLQSTGRKVHDGQYRGTQPPLPADYPFAVFYPITGGGYDGPPLTGPSEQVTQAFQATCTGQTRAQAQALADELQGLAHGRLPSGAFNTPLAVPGYTVLDRAPDPTPPGVMPVGDPPNRVWNSPVRFTVTVTPTTT